MHLIDTYSGDAAVRAAERHVPFGPGFPSEISRKVARLEVYGSDFSEPGPDYCLFRAVDAAGYVVGERQVAGF